MAKTEEIRYSKEKLLGFQQFRGRADLLSALLKDGQACSVKEADAAIDRFMKGKVK